MRHGPLEYHVFLDSTRIAYPRASFEVFFGTPVELEPREVITSLRIKGSP